MRNQVMTKAIAAPYGDDQPQIIQGRMTSDQLIYNHARFTYNAHGHDYLTVPDSSPLRIDRYLTRFDSQGMTDATHESLVAVLDGLPIGTRVTHHWLWFGWRNSVNRSKHQWLKVDATDWVVQD